MGKLYRMRTGRLKDLSEQDLYELANRTGKGIDDLFRSAGYETPIMGDRGDAASGYYNPQKGAYSEGDNSVQVAEYGPSEADCAAVGARLENGACVSNNPSATGTQFKPIPTEEIPDGGEEDLPPWVREGIERCQQEDKLFDAASGECVDDPDRKDEPPVKRTGGGGGGGGGLAKPKTAVEERSRALSMAIGGAAGTAVGAGLGFGGAKLGKARSATGGTVIGALVGGVLGAAIAAWMD